MTKLQRGLLSLALVVLASSVVNVVRGNNEMSTLGFIAASVLLAAFTVVE